MIRALALTAALVAATPAIAETAQEDRINLMALYLMKPACGMSYHEKWVGHVIMGIQERQGWSVERVKRIGETEGQRAIRDGVLAKDPQTTKVRRKFCAGQRSLRRAVIGAFGN